MLSTIRTAPRRVIRASLSTRSLGPSLLPIPFRHIRFLDPSSPRTYATVTTPPPSSATNTDTEDKLRDAYLRMLVDTSQQPFVFRPPPEEEEKMTFAWILLYQILLYLGRDRPNGEGFLNAFATAPAPAASEIGQARPALTTLLLGVTNTLSGLSPENSPILSNNSNPIIQRIIRHREEFLNAQADLEKLQEGFKLLAEGLTAENEVIMIGVLSLWTQTFAKLQMEVVDLATALEEAGFKTELENNSDHQ